MRRANGSTILIVLVLALSTVLFWPHTARPEKRACADCHQEQVKKFERKYRHAPVAKGDCEACHLRHGFSNMLILKKPGKQLCLLCHTDFDSTIAGAAHVHPAVTEGLCVTCHDPHASDRPGLLRDVNNDLACFVCHKAMADTTGHPTQHRPFAERNCTTCHVHHAGAQPKLLLAAPDSVCATCHNLKQVQAQHAERGMATRGLGCSGCHDPHRSSRPSLVSDVIHLPVTAGQCDACHQDVTAASVGPADSTWNGCQTCHDDIGQKLAAATVHAPAVAGDCQVCHSAHGTGKKKLLRGGVAELCQSCHDEMTLQKLSAGQSLHQPVAEGRCQSCHEPHGTANEHLLKSVGDSLCISCHSTDKFARSDHLRKADLACSNCHLPHQSLQPALLREEPRAVCGACHEPGITAGMVAHQPVKNGDCAACHDPHAGEGSAQLRAAVPELCYGCHQNIARFVSSQAGHPPAGECLTCHGGHQAPQDHLLQQKAADLCRQCHDLGPAPANGSVHAPFADGDCAGCHNPHGSPIPGLIGPRRQLEPTPVGAILRYPTIDSTAASLCQVCHRDELARWREAPVQHEPVKRGACDACHAAHQAESEHLLIKPANALCQGCHDPAKLAVAAHKGFDLQTADCSGCHDPHAGSEKGLIRSKKHPPFADGNCDLCHSGLGGAQLTQSQPDLCLACHDQVQKDLQAASVHAPAAGGECTSCHNPHTSNQERLLVAQPPALCVRCHTLTKAENTHEPYTKGKCLTCHVAHGSAQSPLLARPTKELCLDCHKALKDRLAAERPHKALDKGCLSCHAGHSSGSQSLLKAAVGELCAKCHDTKSSSWTAAHAGGGPAKDCTSCHDPHSSPANVPALLKANQHVPFARRACGDCHGAGGQLAIKGTRQLCGRCHQKTLAEIDGFAFPHAALADTAGCVVCHSPHVGSTPALLRKSGFAVCLTCHPTIKLTGTNVHQPAAENCATCHTPHGGSNKNLTVEADVMALCMQCHDGAPKTHFHPMGKDTKNPRGEGPIVCTSCHSPHNSDQPALLLRDPGRELCVLCHDPSTEHMLKGE